MSKIVAEFDTEDKTLSVTKDGKKLKDISEVEFYSYGDMASVEIRSTKYDEDEKTVTVTRIIANDKGEMEESEATEGAENRIKHMASLLFPHKKLDTGV